MTPYPDICIYIYIYIYIYIAFGVCFSGTSNSSKRYVQGWTPGILFSSCVYQELNKYLIKTQEINYNLFCIVRANMNYL